MMTLSNKINAWNKVRDLLYYDGPLISLFRDNTGKNWIYYWVDDNPRFNVWLIYEATEAHIQEIEGGCKSIRDAILSNKHVYLVDIDDDAEIHNARLVMTTDIPSHYLPEPTV